MSKQLVGPLFIRRNGPFTLGAVVPNHAHNFPHVTFIRYGAVDITADGVTTHLEAPHPGYGGLDHMLIPASVRHEIHILIDGTLVDCVYPHLNAQDEVTWVYEGNERAYGVMEAP